MKNLEELKSVISIMEVASHLGLHLDGYKTNCPFKENHKNSDEHPSLLLQEETGRFKCMTCGAHGDSIDLYAKTKSVFFVQALSDLASFYKDKISPEKFGRVNVFSEEMIRRFQENLWQEQNKSALDYLHSRNLSDKIIKGFVLGWNGQGITIPRFLGLNGEKKVVGIKIRLFPDKGTKYISEHGSQNILYNHQCLVGKKTAWLLEGEFDVMVMWQLGFRNVVSSSSGAGSFPMEFKGYFDNIERIYLFYDNDDAGQDNAERVAGILGTEKCVNVKTNYKDANEILVNEKEKALTVIEEALKGATVFPENKMTTLASFNPYMKEGKTVLLKTIANYSPKMRELLKTFDENKGLNTGWTGFDRCIKGVKNNYCYLVGGDNKVGKSFFVLNLIFRLAQKNVPQVYLDLENGETESLIRIVKVYRKWSDTDIQLMLENAPEQLDKAVDEIEKLKIMYYDAATIRNHYDGKLTLDVIEHILVGIAQRLKSPFIFYLDHLKYFDIPPGQNEFTFYAEAIRRLVDINNSYNCSSFILAHLKKGLHKTDKKSGQAKAPFFPSIEDIAGSHMLPATAKCTLLLYRDYVSKEGNSKELKIRVASGRSGESGDCSLLFGQDHPQLAEFNQ